MKPFPSSPRRALPVAVATALAVLCLALASGFRRAEPEPPPAADGISVDAGAVRLAPGAPQWNSIRITEAQGATRTWSDAAPARVRIDEQRASRVGTPLPGRIVAVHVDLGERVEAGAPLVTVASPAIAELRADEQRASSELALARRTVERVDALVHAEAVPAKEALAARQQLAQAEVAHWSARTKLAALHVNARTGSEFTLVAPQAGVVVEKDVLPGQEIAPEAGPLLAIADVASVWVVADLLAADAVDVRAGAAARVEVPALPDRAFEGVVERVSAVVDPERNTVPVRIRVDNPDGALRPNLFVQARIERAAAPDAVEVPASAIVSDGARQYVFVQEEAGRFVRREVVARSARSGRVPVVGGLRAGESIVSGGAVLLGNHLALAN